MTKSTPLDRQNLYSLTSMLAGRVSDINDAISGDKPDLNKASKNLRSVKLLIGLADAEIKQLRAQK